ncbi:uncharacterized protein B0H64DRAFT_437118 [Chaetomium fimeti]|uniref:C-type lectin domain-containing protein n=1 Tax=Chaetomium fimeti TaxID=1854472 RepID=A0AAE0HNS1_9PEZI|nr:hypothetical protein B0H64DRAFT_437118 [Chaetomium fimeti]
MLSTTGLTILLALRLTPSAIAQTSTVRYMPTPVPWQEALSRCQEWNMSLYPVPKSTDDPVYDALNQHPLPTYWISRRRGGSCTCLNREGPDDDKLEELPCGEELPAFCG